MNDIPPLVLAFAMFFASIAMIIFAVFVWGIGQFKRERLATAVTQLNAIIVLANDNLLAPSPEKRDALNRRITDWDKAFSHLIGVELPRLAGL